jgi:cytochrome subunit of sulfide dehydrogenase
MQAAAPVAMTEVRRSTRRDRTKEGIVRSNSIVIVAVAVVIAGPAAAQGSDPNLARNLAATCANCHGTNGVSQGGTESLAGARKDDLVRKMQEYRAGTKPGTIMPQLAKGYTDAQIELIAGWFATQKAAK